ncbi:MAG: glycosyltransferase family 4 protein [Methanomassiliicoccales archaeon]|nr:glycosyltransferase family 4 protein [Methanomassiliicoccales archaeon]
MRIIQVCHITKDGGGIESYVENLLKNLPLRGCEVSLIGYDPNPIKDGSYEYYPIVKRENRWMYLLKLYLKSPFIKIFKEDILHFHRLDDMLPFLILHKKTQKVCTLHGKILENVESKHSRPVSYIYDIAERIALRNLIKQNTLLIAVDEGTKNYYLSKEPGLEEKIVVIPVGVDTDMFKPMNKKKARESKGFFNNDKIVLYIGRLEKEKDIGFLLQAFNIVLKKEKNAKLVIVGEGREKEKLKGVSSELGIEKNVVFMGNIPHSKIPEIMNSSDVLVLCSKYEGSPTIVKEAISCGIPVVSTDVGDVWKLLHNNDLGEIVRKDESDYANGILRIISGDRIDNSAFQSVKENLSIDRMIDEILKKAYSYVASQNE